MRAGVRSAAVPWSCVPGALRTRVCWGVFLPSWRRLAVTLGLLRRLCLTNVLNKLFKSCNVGLPATKCLHSIQLQWLLLVICISVFSPIKTMADATPKMIILLVTQLYLQEDSREKLLQWCIKIIVLQHRS